MDKENNLSKSNKEPCLECLKEDYKKIQLKYNLPSFDELNRDFHIESIADVETDYLIREVRKVMADKIASYMRLIETMLHPVNTPFFVFSIIKTLGVEEKNTLSEIYKKLVAYEVDLLGLDLIFSENKDAEYIKKVYFDWQIIKKDLDKIIDYIRKNLDTKFEINNKGYFG